MIGVLRAVFGGLTLPRLRARATAEAPLEAAVEEERSRPLKPSGYLLAGLLTAIAAWAALASLPSDRYGRFKLLRDTDYIKGQWIYERLNFDSTPVDVAFLGTSHTLAGVDSALVEGIANESGQPPLHAENLALPHYGRDLDFLLARLLAESKRPKILIVEADYIEFRVPHPSFPLIAETRDVLEAPAIINLGYFDNLIWLAKRRLRIFENWLLSGDADGSGFDPAHYPGLHWNDAYRAKARGGFISAPRTTHPPPDVLEREARREVRSEQAKAQRYQRWGWLELRYHHLYLERLATLAHRAGIQLVFLYLPPFTAPELPADAARLRRYGELWVPPERIMRNPALWYDKSHLNYFGSQALSQWLGEKVREAAARVGTISASASP